MLSATGASQRLSSEAALPQYTNLLLASPSALRVEVPVRVKVPPCHPKVLHCDHRPVCQVYMGRKEGNRHEAALL